MGDKFDLQRFKYAQDRGIYEEALSEIKRGKKETHWMWFIFPQLIMLGYSSMAKYYGIKSLEEAKAYLKDPVLGERLVEISYALLSLDTNNATKVFGVIDDMKLQSSMTLFHIANPKVRVFSAVLKKFFNGRECKNTLDFLNM